MKRFAVLLIALPFALGLRSAPQGEDPDAAISAGRLPAGYRDWRLISLAHEEGDLHSIGAVLGNDVAIQAYREGKLPFPDGTVIAALHYKDTSSQENDNIFGKPQSFVAGTPTNVQFMVKDSKKYAATGGWRFAHFVNGKPDPSVPLEPCFACHRVEARDLVFTKYAP